MLDQFFQVGLPPPNMMDGDYDLKLVLLSYLVAVFASYIALDITGRLREFNNTDASRLLWILGGSIAMGTGIWSMHFIGMLSFKMPDMTMHYELFWTILSLIVAILASAFALLLLKTKIINIKRLALGGIILGLAIASMHYTGMQGMKSDIHIKYMPGLFLLSIIIAIVASEAALWLALKSNQVMHKLRVRLKLISALIMGIAICGMHYTGMAAAVFTPKTGLELTSPAIDPTLMAIAIAGSTIIILGIAFFASTYKESLNQEQLEKARQLGMAEVSASVLHNVGNVLNSINVGSNILLEQITNTKLKKLDDLSQIILQHKNDFGNFVSNDPQGQQIPEFLIMLNNCQKEEQKKMTNEAQVLITHLQHINDIIAMHQNLSKTSSDLEQILSIEKAIDEALLMTDIDFSSRGITVKKQFEKNNPILVDKVKLLQILVNLLRNAKDSLLESTSQNKALSIKIKINGNRLYLSINDNGIGISQEQMKKMFIYGYSTKTNGHGYGLHGSILSARAMGADLKAESEGKDKGATFILDLPYKLPNR
jgi:NO-binding membrane sensor protein with MHYT domain